MIGWFIFLLIIGAIDFYAFQALKTVTKSPVVHVIYWLLTAIVVGNFIYHYYGFSRSDGFSHSHGYAFAFLITIGLPKLILLGIYVWGKMYLDGLCTDFRMMPG